MRTRTEITVEMDRWIVVSRHSRKRWCTDCARMVDMISVDDAALYGHVNSRTIFSWAESGGLHSCETEAGLLLICPNSPNLNG